MNADFRIKNLASRVRPKEKSRFPESEDTYPWTQFRKNRRDFTNLELFRIIFSSSKSNVDFESVNSRTINPLNFLICIPLAIWL